LAKILNQEYLARQKLTEVDSRVSALAAKTKNSDKSALIALYTSGKVSVFGPKSRFGVLHQAFGIKAADPNIQESNNGQVITFEFLKKTDPDYIFVIDRARIIGEETLAQSFFDNDVVKSTRAYKNKGLIFLNTEIWYTVSGGIQSMTKMIDEISDVVSAGA
jgi:iron complex transport system substrate-binding protein